MWNGIQNEKTEGRIRDESQLNGLIIVWTTAVATFPESLFSGVTEPEVVSIYHLELSSVALACPAAFITKAGLQGCFPSGIDGVAIGTNQWNVPEWLYCMC